MARLGKARGDEQGAAAAEFALSTLLLVPVLLYAMFAAEVFIAAAKAQEAEYSAAFDVTAYRLHDFTSPGRRVGMYQMAVSGSQERVAAELRDLDSFATGRGAGRTLFIGSQSFEGLACAPRRDHGDGPEAFSPVRDDGLVRLATDGWVGCEARVRFRNEFIPDWIHPEFSKNRAIASGVGLIEMCGMGNTVQGCRASERRGMLVLTDDWSLENASANPVGSQSNPHYWQVGNEIYRGGPGAGAVSRAMAALMGLGDKGDTSTFKLDYRTPISTPRSVPVEAGPSQAHTTPWDEPATSDTFNVSRASEKAYRERSQHNYLGKSRADYNAP